jgi:phosphoglycerate dehydrogenase-like enzyme
MPSHIIISPIFPGPILDVAKSLLPDGYQLLPVEPAELNSHPHVTEAEFLIGSARYQLNADFFRVASRLRLVQLLTAGYDRCDIEAARTAGIPIATNGGANSAAVAEHTLLLMLAAYKRLVWQHKNTECGLWRVGNFADSRFYELEGKTLGIIGLGKIGRKVARRAAAFEMHVIYFDTVRLLEQEEDALGVHFAPLPELLRTSDVVTLHVPLDKTTKNLLGGRELSMMKSNAVLINTARGGVVDEQALCLALRSGKLAGAGLDVFEVEPLNSDNPLLSLENVTLTPHTAGPTWDYWPKAFRNAFENIQRITAGLPPYWVIPELI